jgi:hypothetical protein
MSSLSFTGLSDGSLTVQAVQRGTRRGPEQKRSCGSLVVVNGTFDVHSGGTWIGSGSGEAAVLA